MVTPLESYRTILNLKDAKFVPLEVDGYVSPGLHWANINYDNATGQGCMYVRLDPGVTATPHEHTGYEEFLILEGCIIDCDGAEYREGDFVSLAPGSRHFGYTPNGVTALAIFRGGSGMRTLEPGEEIDVRR